MAKSNSTFHLEQDALQSANLPEKYWGFKTSRFSGLPKALEAVEQFTRKFRRAQRNQVGLLLTGPTLSGKTFLAVHAARLLLANGYSVSYFTLDFVTDAYFNRTADTMAFLERFKSADLVVFDSVNETLHRGQKVALTKAIVARSETGKPMLVCSQLDYDELDVQYGKQIASIAKRDLVRIRCALSDTFKDSELLVRRKAFLSAYAG